MWKRICALMVIAMALCAFVPVASGQGARNPPTIRVGTREVLVPTVIRALVNYSLAYASRDDNYYDSRNLVPADFELFEDGKAQRILDATLERKYLTALQDNLGVQVIWALTPTSKWSRLQDRMFGVVTGTTYYVLAYQPPPSPEGSCHEIKIKVKPRNPDGSRLTTVEAEYIFGKGFKTDTVQVDRRNLLIDSRASYCNIEHSASDPLYGTKLGKQMESFVASATAKETGLSFRAIDFYDQGGVSRVRLVLDFSFAGYETGIPSFQAALVGLVYRNSGELAARFSDSNQQGCLFLGASYSELTAGLCREHVSNHYEAELALTPGEYDVRVAMNYHGKVHQAHAAISVGNYDSKSLAMSGIALCKRFYDSRRPEPNLPRELTSVPVMPFELVPLSSKGIELTPTGESWFKKKEPLLAYFEVYEPLLTGTAATKVAFQMRIIDIKTGELKTDTGLRLADSFVQAGKVVIPIAEQIAIDRLAKGDYRLEVQASDSAGNHTGWHAASFTVE